MNAPKEKLDEIVSVLPGMKSPRNAAGTRRLVLGTYVLDEVFLGDYGRLKALGQESILALPIEKMII